MNLLLSYYVIHAKIFIKNSEAKQKILRDNILHFGQINLSGRPFSLLKGTTTYNFTYNLNKKLPSSFSGDCGKIKYKMEFVVDKPWKFDEKQVVVLNVIQTLDLNQYTDTLKPFEKQLTKTIGFIDSGPISLHVSIPKIGYIFGELIQIQVRKRWHISYMIQTFFFILFMLFY